MARWYFRQALHSRIARQLTLWVFGSLMGIEAAILLPSYFKREQDLLSAQRQLVMTSVESALSNCTDQQRCAIDQAGAALAQLQAQSLLRDYAIVPDLEESSSTQDTSSAITLSTLRTLATQPRLNRMARTYEDAMRYDQTQPPIYLYFRHNTQAVQAELNAYTGRMLGMILLISLVVTTGSMVGIERLIIRPVLYLRTDLQAAGNNIQKGIRQSPFQANRLNRNDELGEIIEIFQIMYGQIWQAIDDHESASVAQQQAQDKARQLRENITHLHQHQAQLLQTEKMTGLSQLVAGVAHEINNPISFIHGNLKYLQTYVEDMLSLIELYQHHYPAPAKAIKLKTEEIDFEFMQKDLPKLIKSTHLGSERVRDIVLSLRNFSRLDEAEMKRVDIHEGIENTLVMLSHRLLDKASGTNIQIVRDYGTLPQVECYAGLLNQVFLSILSNAAEALSEAPQSQTEPTKPPEAKRITLRTTQLDERYVEISISNNGPRINAETQQHIFEPFFTTKPVGKGTGMGLSISYQIVTEKHQGKLRCFSGTGHDTAFVIQIPIKRQKPGTQAF